MTASQRPERVDRAALIEAMGYKSGALSSCDCSDCLGLRLNAVLPLIADAIEAAPMWEVYGATLGQAARVARLVRSLGDEQ